MVMDYYSRHLIFYLYRIDRAIFTLTSLPAPSIPCHRMGASTARRGRTFDGASRHLLAAALLAVCANSWPAGQPAAAEAAAPRPTLDPGFLGNVTHSRHGHRHHVRHVPFYMYPPQKFLAYKECDVTRVRPPLATHPHTRTPLSGGPVWPLQ